MTVIDGAADGLDHRHRMESLGLSSHRFGCYGGVCNQVTLLSTEFKDPRFVNTLIALCAECCVGVAHLVERNRRPRDVGVGDRVVVVIFADHMQPRDIPELNRRDLNAAIRGSKILTRTRKQK